MVSSAFALEEQISVYKQKSSPSTKIRLPSLSGKKIKVEGFFKEGKVRKGYIAIYVSYRQTAEYSQKYSSSWRRVQPNVS
jgi:hypothetical protein